MSDLFQSNNGRWPRKNHIGMVYPSENIEKMAAALGVKAGESVLDVGNDISFLL